MTSRRQSQEPRAFAGEWTMPEMSWLPGIREGHSASLLGPTHATVWLLMKRSGKASAGLGKADTGARTAPGAGSVRNLQTVSSLQAAGQTAQSVNAAARQRLWRTPASWNVRDYRIGGL